MSSKSGGGLHVARGSIQEKSSNLKVPPINYRNVIAEVNLNRDLLTFSLEGKAFR